jgi:nucleoside-diphosphate-sugar epimerase
VDVNADRILVTGANGFIASHLLPHLATSGRKLTLALRTNQARYSPPGANVVVVGDIGGQPDWSEALRGVTTIIHLAGRAHRASESLEVATSHFEWTNIRGTTALAQAAVAHGVSRFLYLSTIGVLGNLTHGIPFDDDSEPNPGTPYSRSKLEAERVLQRIFRGDGRSLVILRPALVCGPGAPGNLARLTRLVATAPVLPFGAIPNRRNLLSINGLVTAIAAVVDVWDRRTVSETCVLADAQSVSTTEIVRAILRGLDRRTLMVSISPRLLTTAASVVGRGTLAMQLCGDLEVVTKRITDAFPWRPKTNTEQQLEDMARAALQGQNRAQ